MTIFVVYESFEIGSRIVYSILQLIDVAIIGQSRRAEDVISFVSQHHPDIVIIDAKLGKTAGVEVLRQLKQLETPPIIIMTSESPYEQYRRNCLQDGADYFFYLPEEIGLITKTIEELIKKQAAMKCPSPAISSN